MSWGERVSSTGSSHLCVVNTYACLNCSKRACLASGVSVEKKHWLNYHHERHLSVALTRGSAGLS